jgi:hypothetical protein
MDHGLVMQVELPRTAAKVHAIDLQFEGLRAHRWIIPARVRVCGIAGGALPTADALAAGTG